MGVKSLSIAVRASGYIYFKKGHEIHETSDIIRQIRVAYLDSDIERERNNYNIVRVDLFGDNEIDYKPLETILKDNKELLDDEVSMHEWVESDGGLYFNPEEDED